MDRFIATFTTERAVPSVYWGSLIHGMLIQRLPESYAAQFHQTALRPFSQWVEPMDAHTFRWHLQVMDDALNDVLLPLMNVGETWTCSHLGERFMLTDCEQVHVPLQAWVKDFFLASEPCRNLQLTLHTATTHKSGGSYVQFPSVELIAASLQRRIVEMDHQSVFAQEDVLRQIIASTSITRYRLQSCTYAMEGVRLPGFLGTVELGFRGPDPLLRLANILFSFAAWSGIGIKTALGMGGCTVLPIDCKMRKG